MMSSTKTRASTCSIGHIARMALVVREMAGACLTDVFELLPTPYSTDLVDVIAHDRDHHRGRVPV